MDQSLFRKLFGGPAKTHLENSQPVTAEGGDAETQFNLGLKFTSTRGTAPNYGQAAECYLRAANQNHAVAQFALATMLADGQGVPQDEATALMWTRRAAQQGHAGAQHNLGMRCRRASYGKVSPADVRESNIEAYKWFRLALAQGFKAAEAEFEGVAVRLTREQVAEGDRRIAAFCVSHPGLVAA